MSFNKFALLGDDEDGSTVTSKIVPATSKATATSLSPANEDAARKAASQSQRGGPASRSGRYPSRGGARPPPVSGDAVPEDPSLPPARFDRSENRHDRGGRGGFRGRGGGGGGTGGRPAFKEKGDRHSRTAIVDSDKQVSQGWGSNTGTGELAIETAAEADAAKEPAAEPGPSWGDVDGAIATPAGDAPAAEGEATSRPVPEEDNTITYDEYLAKKNSGLEDLVPTVGLRQANEGAGEDLFKEAQKLVKQDHEEYYAAKPKAPKTKVVKEVKEKVTIEIDGHFADTSGRGGRGRGRGDRGGGGFRGDSRGGGDFRGRGRGGGGGGRGGERGGGYRGGYNGGPRSQPKPAVQLDDQTAFPSL